MARKPFSGPHDHTNPLIWCAAIICTILATAVILAGAAVFIGYLVVKPKVPEITLTSAQLDNIYFDEASLLTIQLTIVLTAENGNTRARASFYNTSFALSFRGEVIAYLQAAPFELRANSTAALNYVAQSNAIALDPDEAEAVGVALRGREIGFELKGRSRSRWRVWLFGSLEFWLNLNCHLRLPVDRTRVYPRCSTSSN